MDNIVYDYAIVGAGILGLAIAKRLTDIYPDKNLIVLDKETGPAKHQTGRNSGVIHAGVYYAPGSAKARLCRAGVPKLIKFCHENEIEHEQCGKMIVAVNDEEVKQMAALYDRAKENGIKISRIEQEELNRREPSITGKAALYSPTTGIVDYKAVCQKLTEILANHRTTFLYSTKVDDLIETTDEIVIETFKGRIRCKKFIACAGLQSDRIANMLGLADDFRIVPFRGEYFRLSEKHNNIVNHLIYPMPRKGLPFLGVHLTKMIGNYVTVGPNAVLSLGREDYKRSLIQPRDSWSTFSYPGFWKLINKYKMAGLSELKCTISKSSYLARIRQYCPEISRDDLHPYRTGIRAQAVDRSGNMIEDFLIKRTNRTVHVCNAPSPAATSSFAIAENLFDMGYL